MGVFDVFNRDAFGIVSMTLAIDKAPVAQNRLGSMGIFEEKGIPTTSVLIEERNGSLKLIKTAARGTMPVGRTEDKRTVRSLVIPHIPELDSLMAEDLQNIRSFGQESQLQAISAAVNDKLIDIKERYEATWEYHRLGAIKGQLMEADGQTVLFDYFDEFGIEQKVFQLSRADLADPNSNAIKLLSHKIRRYMKRALGGTMFKSIRVFIGAELLDAMTTSPEFKKAYDRFQDSDKIRDGQAEEGFPYAKIMWEELGTYLGDIPYIADDEGYGLPMGTKGLFKRYNAPGTFMETVNTKGKPIYVKQKRLDFDTGVKFLSQSSPLHLPTRPGALFKIELVDEIAEVGQEVSGELDNELGEGEE